MNSNMIMVESTTDWTVVIELPEFNFRRTWTKRGVKYPVDRELLESMYYNPAVEELFKNGSLTTNDKEFLKDVGLMSEDNTPVVLPVDEKLLNRMIKLMPVNEFRDNLLKMTSHQIDELADYAIEHYADFKLDRVELLTKASGRNIMKSIENYKAAQEG